MQVLIAMTILGLAATMGGGKERGAQGMNHDSDSTQTLLLSPKQAHRLPFETSKQW